MTDNLAAGAPLVLDLLNYIEQVEKLKTKPAFTVPTEFFVAHQHELKGLPELQFNLQVEGDDVWLRVPRLQEIAPPELEEQLKRSPPSSRARPSLSRASARSLARSSRTIPRCRRPSTGTWSTSGSLGP